MKTLKENTHIWTQQNISIIFAHLFAFCLFNLLSINCFKWNENKKLNRQKYHKKAIIWLYISFLFFFYFCFTICMCCQSYLVLYDSFAVVSNSVTFIICCCRYFNVAFYILINWHRIVMDSSNGMEATHFNTISSEITWMSWFEFT